MVNIYKVWSATTWRTSRTVTVNSGVFSKKIAKKYKILTYGKYLQSVIRNHLENLENSNGKLRRIFKKNCKKVQNEMEWMKCRFVFYKNFVCSNFFNSFFSIVEKLNISVIYKSIILIFWVNLLVILVYL